MTGSSEFSRRLYIRQTEADKLRELRLRQMFARMNEADKPKPPITNTTKAYYDLWKVREVRCEARQNQNKRDDQSGG